MIASAGLLLAAVAPAGAATLPDAAAPEVALAADITLPSVIVPPGADLALGPESAGHAVGGVAPDAGAGTGADAAVGGVAPGTGAAAEEVLPTITDVGAPTGPLPPSVPEPEALTLPVSGAKVSSTFGYRVNPMGGSGAELHTGIDYAGACGTRVVAADGGTVAEAGWHPYGGGQRIVVDHGEGMETSYNHLSVIGVVVGQPISRGTMLGAGGSTGNSTGCHLHFKVMVDDEKVDPQPWL